MDAMNLDAFIYPGWGNPPRLIGDLTQAGNTPLGDLLPCMLCNFNHAHCDHDSGLPLASSSSECLDDHQ